MFILLVSELSRSTHIYNLFWLIISSVFYSISKALFQIFPTYRFLLFYWAPSCFRTLYCEISMSGKPLTYQLEIFWFILLWVPTFFTFHCEIYLCILPSLLLPSFTLYQFSLCFSLCFYLDRPPRLNVVLWTDQILLQVGNYLHLMLIWFSPAIMISLFDYLNVYVQLQYWWPADPPVVLEINLFLQINKNYYQLLYLIVFSCRLLKLKASP